MAHSGERRRRQRLPEVGPFREISIELAAFLKNPEPVFVTFLTSDDLLKETDPVRVQRRPVLAQQKIDIICDQSYIPSIIINYNK